MKSILKILAGATALTSCLIFAFQMPGVPDDPQYTSSGSLKRPARYREWVYLSSGLDMSYLPNVNPGHSMFDNVFVNRKAYDSFLATGTWPDKTMLVLEARAAESQGSINRSGHYQGADVMGLEVHVKDEARFPDKWAFFEFDEGDTGKLFPRSASCYSCHAQHAAVDTTFVQFYPTLLGIAKQHGTLSPSYVKESGKQ